MKAYFITPTRGRAERVHGVKSAEGGYKWWYTPMATAGLLAALLLIFTIFVERTKAPEALLDIGTLEGRTLKDLQVEVFYGVPYARPAVGQQRFRKVDAMESSSRHIDARNRRYPCVQPNFYAGQKLIIDSSNTSEDCLHLNIYVREKNQSDTTGGTGPSTVYVCFFGWNFLFGGNSYYFVDPRYFVRATGAIVVIPNYRLGGFGYIQNTFEHAPGNMGLLDQVLVLRWVRDNIISFGGNPHNIVLLGQGTGAVTAGYHLMSPMTRGITRRVILHSGCPLMPFPQDPPESVKAIAEKLACGTKESGLDDTIAFHCIHGLPMEFLKPYFARPYYPVFGDAFMPIKPGYNIREAHGQPTQILMGNVLEEGVLLMSHELRELPHNALMTSNLTYIISTVEKYLKHYYIPNVTDIVKYYYHKANQSDAPLTLLNVASKLVGDLLFVCPMHLYANLTADAGNQVFYYMFAAKPPNSLHPEIETTTQMDDIMTLFGVGGYDSNLTTSMRRFWTKFAKDGDLSGQDWDQYLSQSRYYKSFPKTTIDKESIKDDSCYIWMPYLKNLYEMKLSTEGP
ncbi:acetylcholinesterase-like [Ornithodoros turicata]|uniref:acetylcholinesterase-like n=1 Tax=Ornithodoros turicata TaxID=34597 RepID=UPI00313906D6